MRHYHANGETSDRKSIENHERGASHQANVEKDISRTRKNKQDLAAAEKILMAEMQRIEAAALKAFEEDAKRDPFARDEMTRLMRAKSKSSAGPSNK